MDPLVRDLTGVEMDRFRRMVGLDDGGEVLPYPTDEEAQHRDFRENWKKGWAGKTQKEPVLLVKEVQIQHLRNNGAHHTQSKAWLNDVIFRADQVAEKDVDFFEHFISDLGPWNPRGAYCPHCVGDKSPEGLNIYFWDWDWQRPDEIICPYCSMVYPDERYPELGVLTAPRMGKTYTFYIRPEELERDDWRLGEAAMRYVGMPSHVSFTGHIRGMKISWILEQLTPLSLAFALTGDLKYAQASERILMRMAKVFPGYLLHSYVQDVADADPGYAVDHADQFPTRLKRNACLPAYDGSGGFYQHTTTSHTRIASGLWGCGRIMAEMSATARLFLTIFQAYDLVKSAFTQAARVHIEQFFILEYFLDVQAYTAITNKAGPVRAARVAFGLMYEVEEEIQAGLEGYHAILESQFYPDGSMKETPLYGHKPITEDLWRIPEMLQERDNLYESGLFLHGLETLGQIATPSGAMPTLDDCYSDWRVDRHVADIAAIRCHLMIPTDNQAPSDFAMMNVDLTKPWPVEKSNEPINRFYEGRQLACVGFGSKKSNVQMYILGEDGARGHRHAGALTLQLYMDEWDVFPDIGYLWDHPGNQWAKATASHQTVVVDERNSIPVGPSRLLNFVCRADERLVEMEVTVEQEVLLHRTVRMYLSTPGHVVINDLFEVTGGQIHDYHMRVNLPPGKFMSQDIKLEERRASIDQQHSYYPLLDFHTAGRISSPCLMIWDDGARSVGAKIISPCDELITYRSPGWRRQEEIAMYPDRYFDTVVLRQNNQTSQFEVQYEIVNRSVI
jgi:hypothetical protein